MQCLVRAQRRLLHRSFRPAALTVHSRAKSNASSMTSEKTLELFYATSQGTGFYSTFLSLDTTTRHLLLTTDQVGRVAELLKEGVDVTEVDYDRRTALHVAASEGNAEACKLLLEAGADINAKNFADMTAVDIALEKKHIDCVNYLYNQGGRATTNLCETKRKQKQTPYPQL